MTIAQLRSKIHGDIVIGPKAALDEQLVETLENEIQDLKTLNPTSTLTPCPLCCRTFISPTDAIEHTLTIHPRFNLNEVETPKFCTNLKSQVNVRETTFTKLLLNQLSWQQKLAIANEIVDRKNENPQELKVEKEMCMKPNYHVSQYCKICVNSEESQTPPILFEILFAGQKINLPFEFVNSGDASYLVDILGITKGFCFNCELGHRDPKYCRGKSTSRQKFDLCGENKSEAQPNRRTTERALRYSLAFKDSSSKVSAELRKESKNYERIQFPQFAREFGTTEIPKFHTQMNINILTKRVYLRGLE